jgi:O-antigen ligase
MAKKDTIFFGLYEGILIFLVIFSPLFYGSLLPGPLSVVEYTALFFVFLFLLHKASDSRPAFSYPAATPLFIVFLIVILGQCVPLPAGFLKIVSARTAQLYQQYSPLWSEKNFYTLSIYPFATRTQMAALLSFFCIFFVTLNAIRTKPQLERILATIVVWASLLGLYGIMRKYSMQADATRIFSTFGNRNNYASYMVMIIPLCIGYALSSDNKPKKLLFSFLAAMLSVSVFLSLSRAGLISLFLALSALVSWQLMSRKIVRSQDALLTAAISITVLFLLFFVSIEPLKERFSEVHRGLADRLSLYRDSLMIVKDFPLFGVGLGDFRYIFTSYSTVSRGAQYTYLHNDNLQLIIETGMLGSFFYLLFFLILFKDIITQLGRRRDPFVKNIVIAGMSGLLGVVFHGFFDFSFHIPAVSFMFWLILGLIYACVYTHFQE